MTTWQDLGWLLLAAVSMVTAADRRGAYQTGDVRLQNGRYSNEGNVEVYYGGLWGLICDDGWDARAGDVVCRQLGFRGARKVTKVAHFGRPPHGLIWLDDVRCTGEEDRVTDCDRRPFGRHNCARREAAGVVCNIIPLTFPPPPSTPKRTPEPIYMTSTRSPFLPPGGDSQGSNSTGRTSATTPVTPGPDLSNSTANSTVNSSTVNVITKTLRKKKHNEVLQDQPSGTSPHPSAEGAPANVHARDYDVRLRGGTMTHLQGRVEVMVGGKRGVICGDNWGLLEATVVCRQLDMGHASQAVTTSHFGGTDKDKLLFNVKCTGNEKALEECFHAADRGEEQVCSENLMVAGVNCVDNLPDLVPNVTILYEETRLEDVSMLYLQCAMEEDCAARSAYKLKTRYNNWYRLYRRLLRFSSSTHNFGTADFRPHIPRQDWEWHQCHQHYHSMHVFAHYDLLDQQNNRVAEGHKASFCLEDVECRPGVTKKYACEGFADQGISVGCADIYRHNIDCQWIDITDVKPGDYIFKLHVNPEYKVAELNYFNNAVTCKLYYSGYNVAISDCALGPG